MAGRGVAAAVNPDPQCTGARFVPRADDDDVAAALMAGRLKISPYATTTLPSDPRWSENPFGNANWVFQYQTLRWADPLRREGLRTGNQAMIDRYVYLVKDWLADNPYGSARSSFSWYDMAVGVRAVTLVCAAEVVLIQSWLTSAMDAHANVLSDPDLYRTVGNHGLHQNIGLLALGCHRGVGSWRDLAIRRTETLLERSVDTQGVNDEGSIIYQYLNWVWYHEISDRIEACNRTPSSTFDRLALMPTMLAHATKPDGTYVGLGDTDPRTPAAKIAQTQAQFAATRGASGVRPTVLFKTYKRGYAFSRSGWFTHRPWSKESHMSVRYGPSLSRTAHGHEDAGSVTFFALGKDLLWEQGQWGGSGGPNRRYVRSNEAHNVVDIPSATYRIDRSAPLLAREGVATHHLVTVRNTNLSGATWTRTVVHALAPGFIVIDDRVSQSSARKVVQRWYVGSDRKVATGTNRAGTSGAGPNATFLWAGTGPALSVVRAQRDPMVGWRSLHSDHIGPTSVVQASRKASTVRFTTIVVPRPSGLDPARIRLRKTVTTSTARSVEVVIGSQVWRVYISAYRASVRRLA